MTTMTNSLTMSKGLSVIEAQRVTSILEETIEKISLLGTIVSDIVQQRDELSQIVGDEISQIIQEQRALESNYEDLIAQRNMLKGLSNQSKFKENQKGIQFLSKSLRESTKKLCRNLKDNPNIGGNLLKIQNERQALLQLITRTNQDLKDCHYETLMNQVLSDKEEIHNLQDVIQSEKEMTEALKQLDNDLCKERIDHQRQVEEQNDIIKKLKDELLRIKSKTQFDMKYARKEAKANTSSFLSMYNQTVQDQSSIIEGLEKERERESLVHKETIEFLHKKQEQLINECAEWSEKYHSGCEAKQNEILKLTEERNQNLAKLESLQQRWDKEMDNQKSKEIEKIRFQELEELRIEEDLKRNKAAKVIQNGFRIFFLDHGEKRKKMSDKKKKKKKGKVGKSAKKK